MGQSADTVSMNATAETRLNAQRLGYRLLDEHGLLDQGWTFGFNGNKRRVGVCRYRERRIEVSRHYLALTPWAEIEDTIRHEVAHAVVGPGHKHGHVWKLAAIRLGARPAACTTTAVSTAKPNWILSCPTCPRTWERFRLSNRLHGARCPRCHVPLTITRSRG